MTPVSQLSWTWTAKLTPVCHCMDALNVPFCSKRPAKVTHVCLRASLFLEIRDPLMLVNITLAGHVQQNCPLCAQQHHFCWTFSSKCDPHMLENITFISSKSDPICSRASLLPAQVTPVCLKTSVFCWIYPAKMTPVCLRTFAGHIQQK